MIAGMAMFFLMARSMKTIKGWILLLKSRGLRPANCLMIVQLTTLAICIFGDLT